MSLGCLFQLKQLQLKVYLTVQYLLLLFHVRFSFYTQLCAVFFKQNKLSSFRIDVNHDNLIYSIHLNTEFIVTQSFMPQGQT
jgi:hypothetical protein